MKIVKRIKNWAKREKKGKQKMREEKKMPPYRHDANEDWRRRWDEHCTMWAVAGNRNDWRQTDEVQKDVINEWEFNSVECKRNARARSLAPPFIYA